MMKIVKQYYVWVVFVVAVVAQFWFPISTIIENNDILTTGEEFCIQTAPIDPADPFRGRYLEINIEARVSDKIRESLKDEGGYYKSNCYIRLIKGADGFAEVVEISDEPLSGSGILKLDRVNVSDRNPTIRLPFDRYYMAEDLAPEAERIYRNAIWRNDGELTAHVTIRVKNGRGVISGMYIEDVRIEDYVREYLNRNP